MGIQEFTENILRWIADFFVDSDGRDMSLVIGFLLLVIAIFILIFIVSIFLKLRRQAATPAEHGTDRMGAVMGRLERLERTLNEFKTEVLRGTEFNRTELGHLRRDLDEVKVVTLGEEVVPASERMEEIYPPIEEPEEAAPEDRAEELFEEEAEGVVKEAGEKVLSERLSASRKGFFQRIREVFSSKPELDEEMLEELEATLISTDLGTKTVASLMQDVASDVENGEPIDQGSLIALLKIKILNILEEDAPLDPSIIPQKKGENPLVVMAVGVNGVGKTTTVAKLAYAWKESGARVLMVAADTFRAAAVEQLGVWGERLGIKVAKGEAGSKPSSVVFDALQKARAEDFDVVIIDTAGRLHTKSNLMQELSGIKNVIEKQIPGAPHDALLVVDGSTGQNALNQAKEFNQAIKLSGIAITKLDGTPKGGIVVAIKSELGIPIRYIGIGEGKRDLRPFMARDFVEALFDMENEPESAVLSKAAGEGGPGPRRRKDTREYYT